MGCAEAGGHRRLFWLRGGAHRGRLFRQELFALAPAQALTIGTGARMLPCLA